MSTAPPAEAGALLRRRREQKELSQEQVAAAVGLRSANYLSYLETGKVNLSRSKYFMPLAQLLSLSAEDVGAIAPALRLTGLGSPIMPRALQDAVAEYGDKFAELLDADWQDTLAGARFRGGGPETPEDWLDYYRFIRRYTKPRAGS
ncbi:XRE family transcriptional regulator [Deinococcus psychrotolerans]|uniref:XRE family transcriptional regulator n=1 Tax=Deinococcus psychrotolerans TaxID=2489213 RepID=A0A3G8Y9W0_9DEIO|nr:helix-turn-helix transcriptional regulator [Deinococcus psychrotolerans]AZI42148.1 XRE family transcriptional regulator [Deinococcus psychrotolerans]